MNVMRTLSVRTPERVFSLIVGRFWTCCVRNAYTFQHDAIRTCSKRYVLRTLWLNRAILLNRNFALQLRFLKRTILKNKVGR